MIDHRTDGCPRMRLEPRFDVVRFGTGSNDTETDGFVVRQLEFDDGFDDGLTHGQSVLCFALFDDAEAHRSIVGDQQT